jgi:glutaminase
VTTDLVRGKNSAEKFERILGTLRSYAGNQSLGVDEDTFEAEMRSADRNRATGYLMRSQGMISGDVEGILALYLRQCSVQVTCRDLAVMAATLANGGVNPLTRERALPLRHVREVLSVVHTCGMYDAAGQWAFDIGVPAKSGVSGGILVVVPGKGASASTRRGSTRTVTVSAASECARRSPSAWGYTSLPPKPKTPCSVLWSLVKSLFGKGEG